MNREVKLKTSLRRRAISKIKKQKIISPLSFLTPRRLDIVAKVIYARAYLNGIQSEWPEYVYKEHIRAFNNFKEEDPKKEGYQDFNKSFINIIESVKKSDKWKVKSPVLFNDNFLMNGAHRVAASIVLGDEVNAVVAKKPYSANWGYEFFRSDRSEATRIDEAVLDYMTIEYVSIKRSNVFAAIIFPTAEGHRYEVYKRFMELGEIVNKKTFKHDEFIGKEIIKQLYTNEKNDHWNLGQSYDGAIDKASYCFSGTGDLEVYIIEANLDETTRHVEKQFLRDMWGKDKHSIHITDTIEEVNIVTRMFFNENSRKTLKIDKDNEFMREDTSILFEEYKSLLPNDILQKDRYAIEGSFILDLLGIRTCKDLDYITNNQQLKINNKTFIDLHSASEIKNHKIKIDELITDPRYYFYYKGIKIIDIVQLLRFKENRYKSSNDIKDLNDIRLIENFLLDNYQYNPTYKQHTIPNSKPQFSIIIPLYNKSKYISKCLRTIQNQTYKNWECIVIDDGSTDDGGNIVKKIASKDSRIKLYRQKNSGPSAARNMGLKHASGEYVQFVDADDIYPDEYVLEKMNEVINDKNFDAYSGLIGIKKGGGSPSYELGINKVTNKIQKFNDIDNEYFLVRFFIKLDKIKKYNIKFPEYTRVGEDPVFLLNLLSNIKEFYATEIPVYIYNTGASSNSRIEDYSDKYLNDYLKAQLDILDVCAKNKNILLKSKILDRVDDYSYVYVSRGGSVRDTFMKLLEYYDTDRIYKLKQDIQSRSESYIQNQENYSRDNELLRKKLNTYENPGTKLAFKVMKQSLSIKVRYILAKIRTKLGFDTGDRY